ncbi:MAG: polyprenyl synthetase family protein [Nitrospirae bacterium]|nr:MAG: polyprenyl synthetase family protein [Nitrospirota bacterium]
MPNGPPVVQSFLTMEDVWETYREDLEEVEAHIRRNLDSEVPLINQMAAHIFNGGGKRIRPLLLILCARLCGYTNKEDLLLGSLIEFIHTATLLHDDVLDEADLRRGQQTVRRIWGNQASILVGDYLYSKAMQQIANFHNHSMNEVLSDACRKMAEGEILQLCATNQPLLTEPEYLRIVEYKTGALVAAACKVGAILGGAPPAQQMALYRFGLHLGIAFQLADDRLDYTANGTQLGKTLGQDFMQGMVTLPLLHLLRTATYEERQWIITHLHAPSLDTHILLELTDLMQQYGSLQYTLARSRDYINVALLDLEHFDDSPAKRSLAVVADYMVSRER